MKKIWSIVLILVMLASAAALPALAATGGTAGTHGDGCLRGNHSFVFVEYGSNTWWVAENDNCVEKHEAYYMCSFCPTSKTEIESTGHTERHNFTETLVNGIAVKQCQRCGLITSF